LFQRYRKTFEDKLGGRILTSVEQDGSTALGPLCVNALRKNEIIVLKPDVLSLRKTRAGDLDVSFLNGEQRFRPGGALIARAAGAPLLSVSIHRPLDFLPTRCVIGPPVEVAGDIRAVVEAQATRMEAEVRQDPACWSAWLVRSAWDLPQARLAQRVS